MSKSVNDVYDLDEGESAGCYFCMSGHGSYDDRNRSYRRGEAFLAGPEHTPRDGNANYVCMHHLDEDAVLERDGVAAHPREFSSDFDTRQKGKTE